MANEKQQPATNKYRPDHGWKKVVVSLNHNHTLYLSVPFTWMLRQARLMAESHDGPVIAGGPAVDLMGCDGWAESPGVHLYAMGRRVNWLRMHNPDATVTTRGCIRKCPFCAVPQIEGEFRELPAIDWRPSRIVCDNNILASSRTHFHQVIDSLRHIEGVDFNQGLDARLLKPWHVARLKDLKKAKIRFSLDHTDEISKVADAIKLCTKEGVGRRRMSVYVLLGYNDTPEDARRRLEFVRKCGLRPFPMRYQPLDSLEKNSYVAPGWTQNELKRMVRYYAHLRWLDHIPYEDYQGGNPGQMDLDMDPATGRAGV